MEAALEQGTDGRIHDHPQETYQCCRGQKGRHTGYQRTDETDKERSRGGRRCARGTYAATRSSRHGAVGPDQPSTEAAPASDAGRPGVGGGGRQHACNQPESEVEAQRSDSAGHTCERAVGIHLPVVAAIAFLV